ncbi:MAG: hypothetical protein U0790_23670 [Isosphaeraceae bacterium]
MRSRARTLWRWMLAPGLLLALCAGNPARARAQEAGRPSDTLPGTAPLTMTGDIASELVAGVDRFLLKKIEQSTAQRARHWNRDLRSAEAYNASIEPNRRRLAHILGVRDPRVPFDEPQTVGTLGRPDLVASAEKFNVLTVRWPAFGDVHGEGLLLEPGDRMGVADVVVIPDADTLPEQLAGLPGFRPSSRSRGGWPSGCRVIVPVLIDWTARREWGRARS